MNTKVKNLLSLAARSGNIVSGDETCINYLRKGAIYVLILAEDASDNTKKKFNDKSSFRNVPIRFWKGKEELGNTIGKTSRTVVGIIDKGFAEQILKYLE